LRRLHIELTSHLGNLRNLRLRLYALRLSRISWTTSETVHTKERLPVKQINKITQWITDLLRIPDVKRISGPLPCFARVPVANAAAKSGA
jgi:hypothetical protein